MSIPHVTPELVARIDRFSACFHAARMKAVAALPGNPFGVEVQNFGNADGVACKVRHPLLQGKNRILGFTSNDIALLNELLGFYRKDALRCSVSVPYGQMTPHLFHRLDQSGLWSAGAGTVPSLVPDGRADDTAPPTGPEIEVSPSGSEEKELYLDVFQQAFAHRKERDALYRLFQWAEDALPNGARYLARIAGKPVGMASLPILEGVGFFGTAGVLPEYRGRGVQIALLRWRIAEAPALNCTLLLGGGSPGTTTYRNFARVGLRLVPCSTMWIECP